MSGSYKAGFTLIEVLIVMAMIGIMASIAVMSISGGGQRRLEEEAERLQKALQLAADEAVYQGTEIGAGFTQDSYDFFRYDADTKTWHEFTQTGLRPYYLPPPLQVSLSIENKPMEIIASKQEPPSPSLIFLPDGEMMPFAVTLTLVGDGSSRQLTSDGINPIVLTERPLSND